jgi:hypothetical protein
MTAVAVLNIVFGGLGVLNGLFFVAGALTFMRELARQGVFEIPVERVAFALLALATGIVGLIAGIGILKLRPWARALSFAYAGLLILLCGLSFAFVPIIASIGTYDPGEVDADGLARLIVFGAIFLAIPLIYAPVLCIALSRSAWKATFTPAPPPLPKGEVGTAGAG